jgi:hypothetical protein
MDMVGTEDNCSGAADVVETKAVAGECCCKGERRALLWRELVVSRLGVLGVSGSVFCFCFRSCNAFIKRCFSGVGPSEAVLTEAVLLLE